MVSKINVATMCPKNEMKDETDRCTNPIYIWLAELIKPNFVQAEPLDCSPVSRQL
jgi:hypothetical protein